MNKKVLIGVSVLVALSTLLIGTFFVQASRQPEQMQAVSVDPSVYKNARWVLSRIDNIRNVDTYMDVSIEPETGQIFVSYYDEDNMDLYVAIYDGTSGDCGPDNTWHCYQLATSGDVGKYNSVATKATTDGVAFIISYFDASNSSLRYIEGQNLTTGFTWSSHRIRAGTLNLAASGLFTSAHYDSNGTPYIAFQYSNKIGNDKAMIAWYTGGSGENCGLGDVSGQWHCDDIDSGPDVGEYNSLRINSSDNPVVAYYDGGNQRSIVAFYNGSNWVLRNVARNTLDVGKHVSLMLEDDDTPHIAYQNVTSETLEYASYVGSGGNCGFSSSSLQWEWQCIEIEKIGSGSMPEGLDLTKDGNGHPLIAYQSVSSASSPPMLKTARPGHAIQAFPPTTNCGPQSPFFTWVCDVVDDGSALLNVGGGLAVDTNGFGLPTIAYHELSKLHLPPVGTLKVASQALFSFIPLASKGY